MSINLKMFLYTSKVYADGTSPVIIQYTINGVRKKKVIHNCLEKDWDVKTCRVKAKVINSAYTNNYLTEEYIKAERNLFGVRSGNITIESIFEASTVPTLDQAFDYELTRLVDEMKTGPYKKVHGFKLEFEDLSKIRVSDIDVPWLKSLCKLMAASGNKTSTIQKKMRTIRSIANRYTDKKFSEEIMKFSVKSERPVKQKLTSLEINIIETLPLKQDTKLAAVRDMFLLQVYLRGIRIGDILQAYSSQFKNGRFIYADDKTGQNYSIKLIPRAIIIVNRYMDRFERLFPLFSWTDKKELSAFENKSRRLKVKESRTVTVNYNLKRLAKLAGIDKPLSSHIARHTYARMAIDKINNPMITMELLGHSSLAMHQTYLNDIRKDDELDKANDDIFE
ncbi:tyrosine-type recombinase/integrase [Arcticibacter sp.]|uniref:tyrosine-type recombinase/integrase n=1 Tax=Arcticibacter sp. TaxID=1872630 RepID=UPI00388FC1D6